MIFPTTTGQKLDLAIGNGLLFISLSDITNCWRWWSIWMVITCMHYAFQFCNGASSHIFPPFPKISNSLRKFILTQSHGSFLQMATRRPMSMKGLCLVSSARGQGLRFSTFYCRVLLPGFTSGFWLLMSIIVSDHISCGKATYYHLWRRILCPNTNPDPPNPT